MPYAVPLMRASDTRTMSVTPCSESLRGIGREPASGMPAATGPALRSTSTCSGPTGRSGSSIRSATSAGESNTTAGPSCSQSSELAAALLMIAPSGASDPRSTVSDPALPSGSSSVRITDCHAPGGATSASRSRSVRPSTSIGSRCNSGSSAFSTAGSPPASWKSSM